MSVNGHGHGHGRRTSLGEWFPVILKYVGVIGTVALAVVWVVSTREPPFALLAAFGAMYGAGEATDALRELKVPR